MDLTITKISDILSLIASMKEASPELRAHAETLEGPRKRGSRTDLSLEGLKALHGDVEVTDSTDEVEEGIRKEGCQYFRAKFPETIGMMGAMPIGAFIDEGEVPGVRVRRGPHGFELFLAEGSSPPPFATDEIWFVVGEHNGVPALFTWHPGPPLAVCGITESTAVKIL